MTWLADVRHVLAKDVRQFRWMLIVYLAFVLAAMARGLGWAPLEVLGSGLGPIAVVLTGMIILASIVQTDSPVRMNAFWATHPLRPSAMAVFPTPGSPTHTNYPLSPLTATKKK